VIWNGDDRRHQAVVAGWPPPSHTIASESGSRRPPAPTPVSTPSATTTRSLTAWSRSTSPSRASAWWPRRSDRHLSRQNLVLTKPAADLDLPREAPWPCARRTSPPWPTRRLRRS